MYSIREPQAEALLRRLCLGVEIIGVRWFAGNVTVILSRVAQESDPPADRIAFDELLLTVESRWCVFPSRPERLPDSEEELPAPSLEERVAALACLTGQPIVDATLGAQCPHLVLTFASGSIFFLNGHHERYETWNLSTVGAPSGQDCLIVAVPGDEVAFTDPAMPRM